MLSTSLRWRQYSSEARSDGEVPPADGVCYRKGWRAQSLRWAWGWSRCFAARFVKRAANGSAKVSGGAALLDGFKQKVGFNIRHAPTEKILRRQFRRDTEQRSIVPAKKRGQRTRMIARVREHGSDTQWGHCNESQSRNQRSGMVQAEAIVTRPANFSARRTEISKGGRGYRVVVLHRRWIHKFGSKASERQAQRSQRVCNVGDMASGVDVKQNVRSLLGHLDLTRRTGRSRPRCGC